MLDIFDSLCVLLAKAEQKHYLFTKKMLGETSLKITPGQMIVLYTLYKGDGIPITELGKKVFLDNSTLTGLLDRLEKLGFLFRSAPSEDRRSYHIYLTDKAKELQSEICAVMSQVEQIMTAGCSEADLAVFRKVLSNIYQVL